MNYLQKKKLAFMSIVNRVKGFIRTITGTLPLTLEGCVDEESIIDYTLYGQSVQNGTPTPEMPVEVESVGEKTRNLITATDGYIVKHAENRYIKYDAKTQVFTIHGSGMLNYVYLPETIPSGTTTSIFVEIVNDDYAITKGGLTIGGYAVTGGWANNIEFSATSTKKKSGVATITKDANRLALFVDANASVKNVQVRITYAVCDTEFTEYEPYGYKIPVKVSGNGESITTNIYLDEPLRKVGEYADYIDFENGKVVRNVKEVVLDGGENWRAGTTKTVTQVFRNDGIYFRPRPDAYFCDKFIVANQGDTEKISITEYMYIAVNKTRANNVTDFKKWLSENPTVVAYPLATPTETPITLPNIPTFKGTSIISADTTVQPSNAEIEYYSNVKE